MTGSTEPMTPEEAFARIRLLRSPNVGPVTYFQLLRRFGSASAALPALPELAARGGARYRAADAGGIDAEIEAVERAGARYLFHDAPDYPAGLRLLDTPPPILTLRGVVGLLSRPAVALVGARNASAGSMRLAREWSAELAAMGLAVISGLARGIDASVHSGALRASEPGGTIGVIASGIDLSYPPENAGLQEEVARRGLLIAEMPPGTEPMARHFPWRNRIIAGLASGTVVVEAAPRSGSLITARLATEMGREVMAVPGSPLDPRATGGNQLIRDGAILVQSASDIAELVLGFAGAPRSTFRDIGSESVAFDGWSEDASGAGEKVFADADWTARILALLSHAPVGVDELVRQSGASAGAVQMVLIELELAGRILRQAGGRVSLAPG